MQTFLDAKLEKKFLFCCFVLFLALNAVLLLIHEPWRDEVHAWLMAKNMSITELIAFSGYEGHPVLWHIMLMPLAKLGGGIWLMNCLSYLLVSIAAYIFVFRTKFFTIGKVVILFTVPFLYIYSSIARNYCIVLLCVMVISAIYQRRYEIPFLYSIVITLLIFSHALAWGMVAGLTITFHLYELGRIVCHKSVLQREKIVGLLGGLVLIAVSSAFVVVTMLHGRNSGYMLYEDYYTKEFIMALLFISGTLILYGVFVREDTLKEAIVILFTFLFQVVIYLKVYSSVTLQRALLVNVFMLFFLVCTCKGKKMKDNFVPLLLYYMPVFLFCIFRIKATFIGDIRGNYSSAQEMAQYISESNIGDEVILTDAGIFAQTIVPYTDKTIYDIVYKTDIEHSLYHVADYNATTIAVRNMINDEEYYGKYIIVYDKFWVDELDQFPFKKIYETRDSVEEENFTLFYIEYPQ